jgi:hypothetical protein
MAERISEVSLGTTDVNNDSDIALDNSIAHSVSKSEDTLENIEDANAKPNTIMSPSKDTIVSVNRRVLFLLKNSNYFTDNCRS